MEDFSAINVSLSVSVFLIKLGRQDTIGMVPDELWNGFGLTLWY